MKKQIILLFILCIAVWSSPFCYSQNTTDIMENKVIVITGTSSGLGKAMVELAARKKMKIVLVDINIAPSKKLAEDINRQGGKAIAIKVDLAKPDEREKIINLTIKKFGRIDYLVNNAGYLYSTKIKDIELKQAHHLFEVNFWAYLDLAIRAIPIMKKQGGGTILNVSSIMGVTRKSQYGAAVYMATKSALIDIFRAMATELKNDNINVKVACPGNMNTGFIKNAIGSEAEKTRELVIIEGKGNFKTPPEPVAEEIFNRLNQEEIIIFPLTKDKDEILNEIKEEMCLK